MRVYLSGPMTDLPHFNFPAFFQAAVWWDEAGWKVLNPATHFGGQTGLPREVYMKEDFKELLTADAIALLPGWASSPGACSELLFAQDIGLEIFDAVTLLPLDGPLVRTVLT